MKLSEVRELMKKLVFSAVLGLSIMFLSAGMESNSFSACAASQPLQGKVVMVPSGTSIPAMTTIQLSSSQLSLGQGVSFSIPQNFYYNNTLIAPSGSTVNGTVIQVKKAGRAGINGQLMLKFTNILTPFGQMIPISGKIQTEDGTGLLVRGKKMDTAKEYAKDIAVGTAVGAVGGTVMGPLSGGKVGKGAAFGTAVGAVAGLGKSLWDKGEDVEITPGTQINIVIDQPATVTPVQNSY